MPGILLHLSHISFERVRSHGQLIYEDPPLVIISKNFHFVAICASFVVSSLVDTAAGWHSAWFSTLPPLCFKYI